MNAVATSAAVVNGVCGSGSDSDSNSDDFSDYYQPIATFDDGGGEEDGVDEGISSDPDPIHNFHRLPNGLSSLDLSNDDREVDKEEEAEEEEATELERLMEVERAFREDERRRNAPLTEENTVRVVEAMRRVSFGGGAPDWAVQVPEDQWIDRIRELGN